MVCNDRLWEVGAASESFFLLQKGFWHTSLTDLEQLGFVV